MSSTSAGSSPREAQLGADPGVPVLGERLGELHGQAVQLQVVAVGVVREELVGRLGDPGADGDDLEADDVGLAGLLGPEEVGQAQPAAAALAREGEAGALGAVLVQHDQVVALGHAREVAVDDGRLEQTRRSAAVSSSPRSRGRPSVSTSSS